MERWICTECLEETDELITKTWHSDTYGDETVTYCPACHSENTMEPMEECPSCGNNWMQKGEECCDKCQKSAKTMLGIFARTLTVPQLRWLDSVVEGTALEEFR